MNSRLRGSCPYHWCGLGRRVAALLLCLLVVPPTFAVNDPLIEALRAPARSVVGVVAQWIYDNPQGSNEDAGTQAEGEQLIVAVRPARINLGLGFTQCDPLSTILRNRLGAALNDEGADRWVRVPAMQRVRVRAMQQGRTAPVEVNIEWSFDEFNGFPILSGEVKLLLRGDLALAGEEAQFRVPVERLTKRQIGCLFSLNPDERYVTIPEGEVVTVYENLGYGGVETIHKEGESLHKVASLNPVVEGDQAWWMVRNGARGLGFLREPSWRGNQPEVGERFRDCLECPKLVVVPSGSFLMGSPSHEGGRSGREERVHRVPIGEPFAVGVYEVTVAEFGHFVEEKGHPTGDSCVVSVSGRREDRHNFGWRNPGFRQGDFHPVVCVSWDDARAYVSWLSWKTGERYRLLSESEWEYVARAGTGTARYWGEGESGQCGYANGADASTGFDWAIGCDDGHSRTASVGSYGTNAWRLRDVLGNVWEWTADCWNPDDDHEGAPVDVSASTSGECPERVLRGGSWYNDPKYLRSANRAGNRADYRSDLSGFRVARDLTQ